MSLKPSRLSSCSVHVVAPEPLKVPEKPMATKTDFGYLLNDSAFAVLNYKIDSCRAQARELSSLLKETCESYDDSVAMFGGEIGVYDSMLSESNDRFKKAILQRNLVIIGTAIAIPIGVALGYKIGNL